MIKPMQRNDWALSHCRSVTSGRKPVFYVFFVSFLFFFHSAVGLFFLRAELNRELV